MVPRIKSIVKELDKAYTKLRLTHKHNELAAKYGLDPYQISRYEALFGSMDEVIELLETSENKLFRTIRTNTLKISRDRLIERLRSKGLVVEEYAPTPYGIIVWSSPWSLGSLHEYLYGFYTIQGPASMLAVLAFSQGKEDNKVILDCCAGAGIKSTQLGQHFTSSVIVSIDINRRKLAALKNNLSRLGIANIVAIVLDARRLRLLNMHFNKILVDAPCSGEGLWPYIKKRRPRSLKDIISRVTLQYEILSEAIKFLSHGGELVYSTCTMSVEENEYVVSKILEVHDTLKVEPVEFHSMGSPGEVDYLGLPIDPRLRGCLRLYPHRDRTEGFTICKLVKE
ncbi:MAG: RsmB/NOP family class I SAM-dependent RNA methyltransferase [Pyrodictiaceae archaeon]